MRAIIVHNASGSGKSNEGKEEFSPFSLLYGRETVFGRQLRLLKELGITDFWISAAGCEDEFKKIVADRDFENCSFNWLNEVVYDRETGLFTQNLWNEDEDVVVLCASMVFNQDLLRRLLRPKAGPLAVVRDLKSINSGSALGTCRPLYAKIKGKAIIGIMADETVENADESSNITNGCVEILPFYRTPCGQSTLSGAKILICNQKDLCTDNPGENEAEFIEKLKKIDCFDQPVKSESYMLYRIRELLEARDVRKPIVIEDQNRSGALVCGFLENWGYEYLKYKADNKPLTEEDSLKLADLIENNNCDYIISTGSDYAIVQAMLACYLLKGKRNPYARRTIRHLTVTDGSGSGCEVIPSVHIYDDDKYRLIEDNALLPDNVFIEPKQASELPESAKKSIILKSVCECADIFCSMLSPHYDQQGLSTVLTGLLDHSWGFLSGSVAAARCFLLNLILKRKISYYCGETAVESLAKYIAREYDIPYEQNIAYTAPALWTSYAGTLPDIQTVGGKKATAAMLYKLRDILGVNTNYEIIELFKYMLHRLNFMASGLKRIDLSDINLTHSNNPFIFDRTLLDTVAGKIAEIDSPGFEYPDTVKEFRGLWKGFIKQWRIDLVKAELSRRRNLELDILDEAVRICNDNGLRYFLTYGTLLGAIRHNGFIPWNDNIDIAMPRKDYETFLNKVKEQSNSELFIHNSDTDERCWFNYTRLIKRGTLLETVKEISFYSVLKGIGINIWPMDGVKSASGFLSKLRYRLIRGIDALCECRIAPGYRKMGWKGKSVLKLTGLLPTGTLRRLQKQLFIDKQKSDPLYYSIGQRYRFGREIIPSKAFNGAETALFEGRQFNVPADWDKVLSSIYGNYNKLPPVKKQKLPAPIKVSYNGKESLIRFRILSETAANGSAGAPKKQTISKRLVKGLLKLARKIILKPGKIAERSYIRITGFFRSRGLIFSQNSRLLASYKGKYEGQRCFLIGNGPSLKSEDLDRLKNDVTFGCNLICKIYDQTSWRPTFYCISDSTITRTNSYCLAENMDNTNLLIREFAYRYMKVKPPAICLPYISVDWYKVKGNILAYHYISHSTVMSMLIELAIYMGFKDIYLIGVDGTSASAKGSHFTDNYYSKEMKTYADKIKKKVLKNYDPAKQAAKLQKRSMDTYALLREFADSNGIRIFNATRGGVLEVFERADLDDLISSGMTGHGGNI